MSDDEFIDREPQVTGAPGRIWLVYGELDEPVEHKHCDEVCWCSEPQFPNDVPYIREKLHTAALAAKDAEIAGLQRWQKLHENNMASLVEKLERAEQEAAGLREQIRHLFEDLTHCPDPTHPTRRYVKPGCGLMFSNMVNAAAGLLPEAARAGGGHE